MLSPEGKELKKPISIFHALHEPPFTPVLSSLELAPRKFGAPGVNLAQMDEQLMLGDVLHTNCVRVLGKETARHFPQFKPGQLLISMRSLHALAVLDPDTANAVWVGTGPWRAQHDPSFLENGRLLVFDNLGSPKGSRVLEYDLQTQSFPWIYPGRDGVHFFSHERGMCQRLPNGNTLIVSSDQGAMLEVTRDDQEVVWTCTVNGFLATARRYAPDQLHFLTKDQHARP
jgi:hypothetical protein